MSDRAPLYRLDYQEAMRVIEYQVSAAKDHVATSGAMVRVGMGSMAGVLVVIGLLVNARVQIDAIAFFALAAALVINIIGLGSFVWTFAGIGHAPSVEPGPRPGFLIGLVLESAQDETDLFLALLRGMPRRARDNEMTLDALSRARARGTVAWFLSSIGYLAAFAYISGVAILA